MQNKAKIYQASYKLQQKIGSGPLDEKIIKKCQKVIDENDVDFTPLGLEILGRLDKAVKQADDNTIPMEKRKANMTSPVMELKANAAIFHYPLIGNLANIMLSFMETITELDKDAVEIVRAHHTTLHAIVIKKMNGDGGKHGTIMTDELKSACKRYYARMKKN